MLAGGRLGQITLMTPVTPSHMVVAGGNAELCLPREQRRSWALVPENAGHGTWARSSFIPKSQTLDSASLSCNRCLVALLRVRSELPAHAVPRPARCGSVCCRF